jgi:two-component system, NarL family, nitrate/nitrite response regulator NarL
VEVSILTILVISKALIREGLASLLASTNYKPVTSVSSIAELGRELDFATGIGLFIIDRNALAQTSELALSEISTLRHQHPHSRVLVLSDAFDFSDVLAVLRGGAAGYLMNTLTSETLIKSLDLVMLGETVLTAEFVRALGEMRGGRGEMAAAPHSDTTCHQLEHVAGYQLSSRETAILSRLIQGESNKHIARAIGVAEATVKTHIKAILRKIRVKNRTQAAMWAHAHLPQQPDAVGAAA